MNIFRFGQSFENLFKSETKFKSLEKHKCADDTLAPVTASFYVSISFNTHKQLLLKHKNQHDHI